MKLFLLSIAILLSQQVFAGAPGHGGYFCESNSGRTKVTVIDRYGDGVTVFFSIDDYSSIYEDQNVATCEEDCMTVQSQYNNSEISYVVITGDNVEWKITIDGSSATLRKGFADPRDYSIFQSDISLTCKSVEQQI